MDPSYLPLGCCGCKEGNELEGLNMPRLSEAMWLRSSPRGWRRGCRVCPLEGAGTHGQRERSWRRGLPGDPGRRSGERRLRSSTQRGWGWERTFGHQVCGQAQRPSRCTTSEDVQRYTRVWIYKHLHQHTVTRLSCPTPHTYLDSTAGRSSCT